MKIFLPGPTYPDSFGDNVREALRARGHEVHSLRLGGDGYESIVRYALRVAAERLLGERPGLYDLRVLRAVRSLKPDMVLSLTHDIHPEILDQLGQYCAGRRVLWWGDPPANNGRWGLANPFWDHIYVKDRAAVQKLKIIGKNSSYLAEAMNPIWHRPTATQKSDALIVAGNYYPYRQAIVGSLLDKGVALDLYGPKPPLWARASVRDHWKGEYIVKDQKSTVFGEGLAVLNTFSFAEGDSLNCRAFEAAGAGSLQLIEYRPAVAECFEPGKELLAFDSGAGLLSHVERAKREPSAMQKIRAAGAARAISEHTYAHRLAVIFQDAGFSF